jgi:hypothetical protein
MYAVLRKFNNMRNIDEAGRRAVDGLGPMLRQMPGFKGYYVFTGGGSVGASFTLFESQEAAQAAHQKALGWIRANLADLYEGEPEIVAGEVLGQVTAESVPA